MIHLDGEHRANARRVEPEALGNRALTGWFCSVKIAKLRVWRGGSG